MSLFSLHFRPTRGQDIIIWRRQSKSITRVWTLSWTHSHLTGSSEVQLRRIKINISVHLTSPVQSPFHNPATLFIRKSYLFGDQTVRPVLDILIVLSAPSSGAENFRTLSEFQLPVNFALSNYSFSYPLLIWITDLTRLGVSIILAESETSRSNSQPLNLIADSWSCAL